MVISQTALSWLRVRDELGFKLPADVQEAADALAAVDKELGALPAPAPLPSAADLARTGTPLKSAEAKARKAAEEMARTEEMRRAGRNARDGLRLMLNSVVEASNEKMVLALRDVTDALVAAARPHAQVLASYAPRFSANDIVRQGTPDDLVAYQAIANLEKSLGYCLAAWRNAFHDLQVPGVDVREVPAGFQYFEAPELVENDRLAGRARNQRGYFIPPQVDIANVASEAEAVGFRLATVAQIGAIAGGLDMTVPVEERTKARVV